MVREAARKNRVLHFRLSCLSHRYPYINPASFQFTALPKNRVKPIHLIHAYEQFHFQPRDFSLS